MRMRYAAVAACALLAAVAATAGEVDPALRDVLDQTRPGETVSVLVYLNHQVDVPALQADLAAERSSRQVRHRVILQHLKDQAAATQIELLEFLDELKSAGKLHRIRPLWLANVVAVDAPASMIEKIANHPDVHMVYLNLAIAGIQPVDFEPEPPVKGGSPGGAAAGGGVIEPGIAAVRAPDAWNLGYTGEGIVVATLDTGVDGTHPALESRWRGLDPEYENNPEWAWFDPVTNTETPQSFGSSHGTHTMGSLCGGAPGDQVGVAPGAQWIHAAVIDRVTLQDTVEDAIAALQWVTDPDQNPETLFDVPHICSNSWGVGTFHGYPECDEQFWEFIDAAEAAGVIQLFAAGNEGYNGIRRPADRATSEYHTVAVAAVNANVDGWPIADFSSRGPTTCTPDGSLAIKPDIAGPGYEVRSSIPGGGYGLSNGTSMATPHIAGVMALVMEACPDLTTDEVKQIIFDTAYDLGPQGEDNDFGYGMVDALEAVLMAEAMCGPSPPQAFDGYYTTGFESPRQITLLATDYDEQPGDPLIYRIETLPQHGKITDLSAGYVVQESDLPYELVNNSKLVIYTPHTGYYGDDNFTFAADDGGTPPDAGVGDPAVISLLVQFNPPVITTTTLPDGDPAIEYGPVQIDVDHGQPELIFDLVADQYLEIDLGESLFDEVGEAQSWHADDEAWLYELPFAFPFYGNVYTSCWITSNGFIDFAEASADWTNSTAELAKSIRIAPLWDDLRTDVGGDIYIDESVDGQVTVRWKALAWDTGLPTSHSCTLFIDGRIHFHYGEANSGLSPTIGLSAGDGVNFLLASYDSQPVLTNVNSLEFAPPAGLPEGLTLSETGEISGIPLETGAYEPLIRVTDSLGRTDQKNLDLFINNQQACAADIAGRSGIGTEDLLELLANWGTSGPGAAIEAPFDVVDVSDLLALLASWGQCE